MMTPSMSIVIPVYNGEKYIKETISSIQNQTFDNYEIIIVDDGSIDNTKKIILDNFKNIRYLYQKNSGPSKARNKGIRSSKGTYIAFIDSDDLWTEDKLAVQFHFLEKHRNIDMIFADMEMFDANGVIKKSYLKGIKRKEYYSGDRTFYDHLLEEKNELLDPFGMLLIGNFIPTSTVMIRREFLIKNQIFFDENISSVEDLDFWMRVSIHGKISFLPKVLKKKRVHDKNISQNHQKALKSAIYVRKKIQSKYSSLASLYKKEFKKKLAKHYFNLGRLYFDENNTKRAFQSFKKSLKYECKYTTLKYLTFSSLPLTALNYMKKNKIKLKSLGSKFRSIVLHK